MTSDWRDLSLIADLTEAEADLFKSSCQTLLSKSFIMRSTETSNTLWDFAIRNITLLEVWFSCAGITLKRDELLGVIAMRPTPAMRAHLGKEETFALLVLRLLFEEKRTELTLSAFPSIRVFDLLQRYKAVVGIDLKKTRLVEILRSFSRWKIIDAQGDLDDSETTIALLPSIAMTLDQESIDEILNAIGTTETHTESDEKVIDEEGESE